MKKRSLSLGGRPGPLSHTSRSPFARIPGCDIAESARSDAHLEYGLQQESQSKHPFLSRSSNPYTSQSQRSLSQTCLTQSQSSQRFSQTSQPEEYGCEQWKIAVQDKEKSLSQPKPPSPYFAGLTSSLNRRIVPGNVGGGSTPGSTTCTSAGTSAPLCLVGPQNGTPRPWPQCNVSEELDKRLGSLEKLREEDTDLLRKICDDYQQIKIFLEETCFESKDNRSKVSLQQNALHKLLKEEETANSKILAAIKVTEEAVLQNIGNLKRLAEGDAAAKDIATNSFKLTAESFRETVADFKRDLIADFQAMKQSEQCKDVHHQLQDEPSHIRKDATETIAKHSLDLPISIPDLVDLDEIPNTAKASLVCQQDLPISIPDLVDLDEIPNTAKASLVCQQDLPISIPDVVDLDEIPDPYLDAGQAFLARDVAYPACNSPAKVQNRLAGDSICTDHNICRSVRRKMLRKLLRAQKRVRCNMS